MAPSLLFLKAQDNGLGCGWEYMVRPLAQERSGRHFRIIKDFDAFMGIWIQTGRVSQYMVFLVSAHTTCVHPLWSEV